MYTEVKINTSDGIRNYIVDTDTIAEAIDSIKKCIECDDTEILSASISKVEDIIGSGTILYRVKGRRLKEKHMFLFRAESYDEAYEKAKKHLKDMDIYAFHLEETTIAEAVEQ